MGDQQKLVLAYSGGLDTSVILKWLAEKGFEVICFVGNVGQRDDFAAVKEKALATGASKVHVRDLRREFVTDFIFPALWGNAIYESRYLLGTALARPLLARAQMEVAAEEGARYVAHGATGKGNDQVRFELTYYALDPAIKVIAPWKDPEFLATFKGRSDMIAYAEKHGIPVKAQRSKPYSEDENLMHISHEAGILEDPAYIAPEEVYSLTVSPRAAPDRETRIEIEFRDGLPVRVRNLEDGHEERDPLHLFEYLNKLGSENGIGRVDMVENRFVGIKSRGIYETPGATILWAAHRDLEAIAMDKEVMRLRDTLAPKFAEVIYNGFWFSPEMDFLLAAFAKSQEAIDGAVTLSLYKGNAMVVARKSPTSLYNQDLSSMEVEGGFDQTDSRGFINIHAQRLKAHHLVLKQERPFDWRRGILRRTGR
ncbi:MAG: Argininosuccinate synthase [Candidatus Ozemobacter sibiricus]|uniref:Argininosuccinate synthase n=1 Tax=Candidatus Ozemobacter sibiricus TaxID=2268124 RepID=A0A367ZKF5_9BACT|nr:MAG: Argininosuccinate synthase [Candidatus Ozemobacter sibiricus]